MNMKQTNKIYNDLQRTNIVTFNLNPRKFVEFDGETFMVESISTYSLKVQMNGEKVIINPMNNEENLPEIRCGELWVFSNPNKICLYNNETHEMIGEIEETFDCLTLQERMEKLGY